MPRAAAFVRLLRPENDALMGLIVIVGAMVGGGGRLPPLREAIVGFIVGFALSASAMVLNDIADLEIDRVNEPARPLPSGEVGLREAWLAFAALSVIGLALSALQGAPEALVAALSYVVAVTYDLKGKRYGLPGNAMVAFTGVSPILYGAVMVDGLGAVVWLEAAMIFLAMMGREVMKGVADVEGDMAHGVRTLAVTLGRRAAAAVSTGFFAAAVSLSPLPPLLGFVSPLAYSVPVAAADVAFLAASAAALRSPSREVALRAKEVELAGYAVALIGFALGSLLRA